MKRAKTQNDELFAEHNWTVRVNGNAIVGTEACLSWTGECPAL